MHVTLLTNIIQIYFHFTKWSNCLLLLFCIYSPQYISETMWRNGVSIYLRAALLSPRSPFTKNAGTVDVSGACQESCGFSSCASQTQQWTLKPTSPKALGAILTCGERYRSGLGETRWRHYCPLIAPASLLTSAMKTGATMQRRWDNQGRSTKNYKYSGTTETPKMTKKRGTGKAYAYV